VFDFDTTILIGLVVIVTIRIMMVVGQIPFVEDLYGATSLARFKKETSWGESIIN
jgi:hypothetical protein